MFEPKSFLERRLNLSETLTHRLLAANLRLSARLANPSQRRDATVEQLHQEFHGALNEYFNDYAQRLQQMRNQHAAEILGPVADADPTDPYVNGKALIELLTHNLGKAWFLGQDGISKAAEGTVGAPGFDKRYKDFVESLEDLDDAMTDSIESGFYADGLSAPFKVAALVIRFGDEVLSITYNGQFGANVVNLSQTELRNGALRSEQYSYRQNFTESVFVTELQKALTKAGVSADYRIVAVSPAVEQVETYGFAATEEALEAAAAAGPATVTMSVESEMARADDASDQN